MIDFVYRFRSIEKLFGSHNELENQEIYFSSLNELNDPMEGFKDIVWNGDKIVWRNLLKHYLLCLEHLFTYNRIIGDKETLEEVENYTFKTDDDLPTDAYKKIIKEIYTIFFDNIRIKEYSDLLSSRGVISKNELINHLTVIHPHALTTIFKVHAKNKLLDETANNLDQKNIDGLISDSVFFNLLNKAEIEITDIEPIMDVFIKTKHQLDLIYQYNDPEILKSKNKMFLLYDFPERYLKQLEKIMYQDWYVACFSKNHINPSMWAHYADKHKGVCLKFKTKLINDKPSITLNDNQKLLCSFDEVFYQEKYPQLDFFRSIGRLTASKLKKHWYTDESGNMSNCVGDVINNENEWKRKYWENFLKGTSIKLMDWSYEEEYRIVLSDGFYKRGKQDERKLKYAFNDLEGIIFGINTSKEDKIQIMKIIEGKCHKENRTDFKFYQSYYSKKSGKIEATEMNLIKFNK